MTEIIKKMSCDPKSVFQNLEVIKEPENRFTYIKDTFKRCAIATPTTKKKRKMTNYNCFVKVMVKKGQSFKEVVKSKAWSTLSDKQKATWKDLANEGCPPRLWEN